MKLKQRMRAAPRIEMLPLIDIVFLLLVFFIYAMLSMAVHRGMWMSLPTSSQAEITRDNLRTISLRNGPSGIELFLDKQPISLEKLTDHLQNRPDQGRGKILLFADQEISYQQLYQVLDHIKEAGISDISLQAAQE